MGRQDADNPTNWSVGEFLLEFQRTLQAGLPGSVWWHDHAKRDAELADLGLTKPMVLAELLKLSASHHHQGPERDDWEPLMCCLHKFRYPLGAGSADVYVKIGVKEHPRRKGTYIARIWSFKRWQP